MRSEEPWEKNWARSQAVKERRALMKREEV